MSAVLDRFLRPVGPLEPYGDVVSGLAALKERSIPYAVLTPIPDDAARGFLQRAGIPADRLVPSSGGLPPPPDKGAFRRAVGQLGARPGQAYFVGDLYWSDVRAAARAGLTALLLEREDRSAPGSGLRIRTLVDLAAILDRPTPVERPSEADTQGPDANSEPPVTPGP